MALFPTMNLSLYSQVNNIRLYNSLAARANKMLEEIESTRAANRISDLETAYKEASSWADKTLSYINDTSWADDTLSFVKGYQESMTGLMDAASTLKNSSSLASSRKVTTDNAEVADIVASGRLTQNAAYTLDVQQLAKSQVNTSNAISADDSGLAGALELNTASGKYSFSVDAGAVNNREAMNDLVEQINSAETGVTASLAESNGQLTLSLTSNETGESYAFSVSGDLAENTGLNNVSQDAQNAVYTITKEGSYFTDGKTGTSDSNTITLDSAYRLTAELKDTGTAQIQVAPDTEKTASALKDLVDSYNNAVTLLNDNADRGTGVLKQLNRLVMPPSSESSMEMVGLSYKSDGTLAFDKETFAAAMEKNPYLVNSIVSGSMGIAQGLYNDAQQGLKISSSSLLSESLKQSPWNSWSSWNNLNSLNNNYYNNIVNNMVNFMGTYSRNGLYNMNNYYSLGLLMNTNI